MNEKGHVIGIDDGTDGAAVVLMTLDGQQVVAGDCKVPLTKGPNGERTQDPAHWKSAIKSALADARRKAGEESIDLGDCRVVCPTAQMHGLGKRRAVLGDGGRPTALKTFGDSVRLWCDAGSAAASDDLSNRFNFTVPQRLLISRWWEEIQRDPESARQVMGLTVPSGIIATLLDAGAWGLGMGDACGAFPVDPVTGRYNAEMVRIFDELTKPYGIRPLLELLAPTVMVGTVIGNVDQAAADYFGLDLGLPIVSPEGDQPTTLAGTFTCDPGVVGFSGGTSCCWNMVADKDFVGRHHGVEPFMTCDGRRFFMGHIQNGTPPMNGIVESYGGFEIVMPLAEQAPINCGGLIILPLVEPEHGLGLASEAHAGIFNFRPDNFTPGNLARAAFMGSMFSLLWSVEALRRQNINAHEFVVSGGIARSDWTIQAITDIFDTPCRVMPESATQASGYGAALMALYGYRIQKEADLTWSDFINEMRPKTSRLVQPIRENVAVCRSMYQAFCAIVQRVAGELNHVPWLV